MNGGIQDVRKSKDHNHGYRYYGHNAGQKTLSVEELDLPPRYYLIEVEQGFAIVFTLRQSRVAVFVPRGPPGAMLGDPLPPESNKHIR